jgi:hypothetical protein
MTLNIGTNWCRDLDGEVSGSLEPAEDEATLSEIVIEASEDTLTQALDLEEGRVRDGVYLSAYRLAEWLIWNWWRLRWEPAHQNAQRDRSLQWRQAHEIGSIGRGWLWPNVTMWSDGLRIEFDVKPSPETRAEPLRYVSNKRTVVSAEAFEAGVDDFVGRVLKRLAQSPVPDADLGIAWRELATERNDAELTTYRMIEARLGFDVDQADPGQIEQIIADGDELGTSAIAEVAADQFLTAKEMHDAATHSGYESDPGSGADPLGGSWDGLGNMAPWRVGADAAVSLRSREKLGDDRVSDARLAELCGTDDSALGRLDIGGSMAFALRANGHRGCVVLRSKWRTGRRFELARLLADRLLVDTEESLRPATRAYTYRQKMQRAFAAELLCPVASLVDFLDDDFSDEAREEAAERFHVSPFAVTAVLVNNGKLERDEIRPMI